MNSNQKLKYVFFGSPEFAAIILSELVRMGYPPEIVICNPDRPQGRKHILTPPPAKTVAEKNGIRIWQPEKLSLEDWGKEVGAVDFGIVAAYSKIIREDVLKKIRMGIIGVHPSLLPHYRGATPIQSALLNGEDKTGVTLYLVDKEVDHGPILSQVEVSISPEDAFPSLLAKLAKAGAELLKNTVDDWLEGKIKPQEQDHPRATFTRKFSREDAFIEPKDLQIAMGGNVNMSREINNKIRALNPEPGTWTTSDAFLGSGIKVSPNKQVKLLESEIKSGRLDLRKIQVEGRNPQSL